ncbi:MAG: PP2C family protein-serine/threonine phosphatase [Fluviicola sp.]|jgi:sigma-B regulation protein RsbU (phosphoserine phosphatase)
MFNDQFIANLESKIEVREFRLHSLLEITRAVTTNQSVEQLTRLLAFIMREQLEIDRFVLFNKEQTWNCLFKVGIRGRVKNISVENELLRFKEITVIESSESKILNEFDVVVPVYHKDQPLAYLLIAGIHKNKFGTSETIRNMTFVQTLTNIVVMAIENKRMAKEQIKQERLKKELEVASEMQKLLFPSELPSNKRMDVSAKYIPRHDIGGDYYDFIPIGDDKYIICIADVSGKGISAAMLMANFQATIRTFFTTVFDLQPFSLEFLIHELNKKVNVSAKGEKFITFFVAKYDATSRELEYINAGHNQPFITNGKNYQLLEKGSVGLGMFDEMPFLQVGKEILAPNTTLVLYTDGVVELENAKKQHFDLDQLVKIVHNFYRLSMEDMNNIVFSKLDEWRGKQKLVDDTAVFSCRFF